MQHIVTLTLNPAIDKSTSVDRMVAEQKLDCAAPKFEPGGGGINVSRGLKKLGLDSLAVFPSGGLSGQRLEDLLKAENISYHAVPVKNSTRENFIVVNFSDNQQYRFGLPGTEIYDGEEKIILNTIKNLKPDYLIASGSLPPGIGTDFLAQVAAYARQVHAKFIVDTSGNALRQAVDEGVYLLKPNLGELSKLINSTSLDEETAEDAAKEIIAKGKCEVIVISMGARGAQLVTKDSASFIPAPAVKKLSTVGAGDSMVSGIVYALNNGKTLKEAVCMGVACGTAATMNPGTELFKKDDALRLYQRLIKSIR